MTRRLTRFALGTLAVALLVTCARDYSNFSSSESNDNCVELTSIQPVSGSNASAVDVVIQGANFSMTAVPTVLLGPHALTSVTVLTSTLLTATVPASIPAGTLDVIVIAEDQCATTLPDAYLVVDPGAITITSIDPAEGSNDVDTAVTINGENFLQDVTEAFVGTTAMTSVTWISATQITAVVPLGLEADTYDVTVSNTVNDSTVSDVLVQGFAVTESGKLYVEQIEPDHGATDETVDVTIRGRNFVETPTAFLGYGADVQAELTDVTFVNSRTLTAKVPAGIYPDVYDLSVTNPDEEKFAKDNAYTVTSASDDDTGDDTDDDTGDDTSDDTAAD